jgi:hypothetical protein
MNHFLKAGIIALVLSVIATGVILQNTNIGKLLQAEDSILVSKEMSKINGKDYMNLVFKVPISCGVFMFIASPPSVEYHGKQFSPECIQVNPYHLRIFYKEEPEII